MKIKSISGERNLKDRYVLLRANFDVPFTLDSKGKMKIGDDYKIITALPTLRYLARYKAKIIILSHLGRPEGADPKYSQKPIAVFLAKLIGEKIGFIPESTGRKAEQAAAKMRPGEMIMLENLRFHKEEEKDDIEFARSLADLAPNGIYVNDAFSNCHRKHASMSAIKKFLPPFAGLRLETELSGLAKLAQPAHPSVAIIGGAKLETKIGLIKKLLKHYDKVLVGGAMANNIFASRGLEVGKSMVSKDEIALAAKIRGAKLILPVDAVVMGNAGKISIKSIGSIDQDDNILDVGPETVLKFSEIIKKAVTIVWNGPLGKFEDSRFRHGTVAIARLVAAQSGGKAFGAVGGGETVDALKMSKMFEYVDLVSTGGGAMLEYLAGGKMPGLDGIVEK
jgi:3-phosphoglycerate kinase